MHPIFAMKDRWALYLASWVPVAGLLTVLVVKMGSFSWAEGALLVVPLCLIYSSICLSAWYLCRVFPLKETGYPRVFGIQLGASFLTSTLWILIGKGWVLALSQRIDMRLQGLQLRIVGPELNDRYARVVPLLLGIGVLLFSLAVVAQYLLVVFEESRDAERRALESKVLAREAELKALKAQVDPHFLFNSLNSVSALIPSDPAGARKMCLLLADFLRQSLNLAMMESIPLSQELALLENFLQIEQVRFGARLNTESKIDPLSANCLLPPLLLQPLLENAVTHGISHLLEGGTILIETARVGETLRIVVENPCDPDRPRSRRKGLGLENVRSRLDTLYGSEARLDVRERNGLYRTEISFPVLLPPTDESGGNAPPREPDRARMLGGGTR